MPDTEVLQSDVRHLRQLFIDLEAMDSKNAISTLGLNLLVVIVSVCHSLQSQLAQHITRREHLGTERGLTKVGLYLKISRLLVHYSCQISTFQRIDFSVVKFRALSCPNVEIDPFVLSIIESLSNSPRGQALNAKAEREFGIDIQGISYHVATLSNPVHAEIQLLLHYEEPAAPGIPPRIICSSKQACFFCNLFFQLHGRFLTPHSHGRLYEKWALPANIMNARTSTISTVQKFRDEIARLIEREMKLQRKPFPPPYESAILMTGTDSLTNLSQHRGHQSLNVPSVDPRYSIVSSGIPATLFSSKPNESALAKTKDSLAKCSPISQCRSSPAASLNKIATEDPPNSSFPCRLLSTSEPLESNLQSTVSNSQSTLLKRDLSLQQAISVTRLAPGHAMFGEISCSKQPFHAHAGKLHLTLGCVCKHSILGNNSRATSADKDAKCTNRYNVRLEWLSRRDCSSIQAIDRSDIVDVETLPMGLDSIQSFRHEQWPRNVYLRKGSDIVILTFKRNV